MLLSLALRWQQHMDGKKKAEYERLDYEEDVTNTSLR